MDEDGVAMCSGPEEGEEVGWMKGWGGNGVEVPRLGWEWHGGALAVQRQLCGLHYPLLLPQG